MALSLRTPFTVGAVNAYVVALDPLVLVDTGPHSTEALVDLESGLLRFSKSVEDIELVLLTHQHVDHVGLAATIKDRSKCTVAAHHLLADFLGDLTASMDAEDDYQAGIMATHGVPTPTIATLRNVSRHHRRFSESVVVDRPLNDGDPVDLGRFALTAWLRPGHSPTDTIFVDEGHHTAIVGDHLLPHISSNPIAHRPLAAKADRGRRPQTLSVYAESLRATAGMELAVAYAGHGVAIERPGDLIQTRLDRQRERVEQILSILEPVPQTAYSVARRVWPHVPVQQTYLVLSEALGALDLLEVDGRVVHDFREGVCEYSPA